MAAIGSRRSCTFSPFRSKALGPLFGLAVASFIFSVHELFDLQSYVRIATRYYDESFHAPIVENGHPHVYKWEELKKEHLPDHGTFYFGPTSHQIKIPRNATYEPHSSWTNAQRALLDDEAIDPEKEKQRCANYNFGYTNRTKRRRLFLGALLADDSFEVLKAVSTEIYNIYHTVSFVESNVTHNLSPRRMRFYDPDRPSDNLYQLYQMYGPKTKVSVDYYSSHMKGEGHDLLRDFIQREGNSFRWALNGMRRDDIAIVSDTDETFTRDFLRALQICDIAQFRPGQDCNDPGIRASTLVFESSPECLTKDRRWYHPDAMLGECVDQIGDINLHPRGKREWPPTDKVKNHTIYHGYRLKGYGGSGDYSMYHAENKFDSGHVPYPLYYATDQRMEGGQQIEKRDRSATGYHFHNFFESEKEIHHKYLTYAHAWWEAAKMPIWELHEDIALGVDCSRGKYEKATNFAGIQSSDMPIYYINEINRIARHSKWQKIVHDEEQWWKVENKKKNVQAAQNIVVIKEDGAIEKTTVANVATESKEGNGDVGDGSSPHPHVYKWEDLKQRHQKDHGTFFFGPHSHQIEIPEDAKYEPQLTDEQRALLDDEEVDPKKEKQRCASYNFDYDGRTERRRLFLGTLLADDSMDILKAVGMEMYNVFHTVSFVESNVTHNLSPRKMRFYDPERPSPNLYQLYQYFGPKTKVSVDYYSNHMQGGYDLLRDFIQREGNSFRWAFNGMRPDDVAVVGDTDETFTRDFLRALQICDIRQFKPGQDCRDPKLRASTFVFESTPECLTKNRRWYHPDAILGECVDQIGDINLHPPTKRDWPKPEHVKNETVYHGWRLHGYGRENDYSKYLDENKFESGHVPYPLYYATDIRMEPGVMIKKKDGSPTGYHFHNFFTSEQEIHHKYLTYGHASKHANKMPIWLLHEDLALGVDCANGKYDKGMEFARIQGSSTPIFFKNPENRKARHEQWQKIVKNEEAWWEEMTNPRTDQKRKTNQGVGAPSAWDSSKSVVLGLATNYGFNIYEQFVGSLRATGYTGHIILGISKDAPSDVLQYLKEQNVTGHIVEPAEKCTYNGTLDNYGNVLDMHASQEWNCPKAYPDYKISWARFLLYRDWLNKCASCTDGVMLTDVRDSIFQSDPFVAAVELKQQAPLMLFEEHPHMKNTHWLTDIPVSSCRKHKVGGTQVLCSGSVMGSREGILDYIDVMATEFEYWKTRSECRVDLRGDDQAIHNYLYYRNLFKNAVSIPHRTGPIHVVGYQAARISEKVESKGRTAEMDEWQTWLPEKYGLIDPNTGYITNIDGRASPQVHQIDRFEHLLGNWRHRMIHEFKWLYSGKDMFCTREGSHRLPNMSHETPMKEGMVIDFEQVRNFANSPLEKVKEFTLKEYEEYMMAPAGKEHYALLSYLSQTYGDCRHVTDIGTRYVSSALAMASNLNTPVWTFDLPTSTERVEAFRGKTEDQWQSQLHELGANITFFNVDLLEVSDEDFKTYLGTWFVMLDTHHRPYTVPFEREFFKRVLDIGFKGLLLLDDIDEHDEMRRWWKEIQDGATEAGYKTYVLTPIGHLSGTGLVDFSGKVNIRE